MIRSTLLAACTLATLTAPVAADPHAGHSPANHTHAGHDPHAGHSPASDVHAGHHMPAEANLPPLKPTPPEALSGPEHAADTVWSPSVMAQKRQSEVRHMHGGMTTTKVDISRLELQSRKGQDGYVWDGSATWGGDVNAILFKAEGDGGFGGAVDSADFRLLWSHAITPWFDLHIGPRYDLRPKPDRAYLALGLEGTAPFWLDVETYLFLSGKGDVTAEVEALHDIRLTQKLILQPRTEIGLSAQNVPELGLGAGLTAIEAGLRLRYEFVPEFAPYVGVEYGRLFGNTRDFARITGEDAGGWSLVLGLKAWF